MKLDLSRNSYSCLSPADDKLSLDTMLKVFFQNKDRAADLLNACFFDGTKFLLPEMIEVMDSDCCTVVELVDGYFKGNKRQRDKLLRIRLSKESEVIVGLEFQSYVDYSMAVRMLHYTSDTYSRERNLGNSKISIVNLVVHAGEKNWTAKQSLKELGKGARKSGLEKYLFDGAYHVCSFKNMDTGKLHVKEVKDAVEGIQAMYAKDISFFEKKEDIAKDSLLLIVAATGDMKMLKQSFERKGEKIAMCEAFEKMKREIRKEGRDRGFFVGQEQGIEKGIEKGIFIGNEEGTKKTCIKMLCKLIGELSLQTKDRIMSCPLPKVDYLIDNFTDFKSEEDIKRYLSQA